MQVTKHLMAIVTNNTLCIARVRILAYVWSYIPRGNEKCESFIVSESILDWSDLNLCSAYLGGRHPCESSSICRYQNLVDIFDSLLDGDSISVSTASTDLKVMGHGSDRWTSPSLKVFRYGCGGAHFKIVSMTCTAFSPSVREYIVPSPCWFRGRLISW